MNREELAALIDEELAKWHGDYSPSSQTLGQHLAGVLVREGAVQLDDYVILRTMKGDVIPVRVAPPPTNGNGE